MNRQEEILKLIAGYKKLASHAKHASEHSVTTSEMAIAAACEAVYRVFIEDLERISGQGDWENEQDTR